MKFLTTPIVFLFAILPFAYAHGFVDQVTIDGKVYKGNTPNNPKCTPRFSDLYGSLSHFDPVASPVRLIDDISPVKGATNKNLNCGQNAQKAALVADANPGSNLTFSWFAGGGEDVSIPSLHSP